MAIDETPLDECVVTTNCHLVEWKFSNINKSFEKLVEISTALPRTKVIENKNNYWHGVCRSLILRFPDDLQILKLTQKGIIQIKSSSRYGLSDLGVNANRIHSIYKKLMSENDR